MATKSKRVKGVRKPDFFAHFKGKVSIIDLVGGDEGECIMQLTVDMGPATDEGLDQRKVQTIAVFTSYDELNEVFGQK